MDGHPDPGSGGSHPDPRPSGPLATPEMEEATEAGPPPRTRAASTGAAAAESRVASPPSTE
eukprot:10010487-Alexandrium_andersonii.AAC.1